MSDAKLIMNPQKRLKVRGTQDAQAGSLPDDTEWLDTEPVPLHVWKMQLAVPREGGTAEDPED